MLLQNIFDSDWFKDLLEKFWEWRYNYHDNNTTQFAQSSYIVVSHDPNDKLGNPGYGEENYVAPQTMSYTVRFENDPEWATAPARWVRVYDELDESFDLDTFQLDSFCLAGNLFTIGNGRDSFNQVVKITIGEDEVYVDVKINLDRDTRILSAEYMAIDPETGTMLMDALRGLLHPNDETGCGEGDIQYSVMPKEGIGNGTKITNIANIYFDFNDPIETPVVEHTIDSEKPTLNSFTVEAENESILLSFAGTDADSGIAGYNIHYSLDGECFILLEHTTENSYVFSEAQNAALYFKVQAVDNAGNVSDWSEIESVHAVPVPGKPIVSADITDPTNQSVTVSAAFSEDSTVREYSYDKENWTVYTNAIVFSENGTIHFRSANEAGKYSEVTTFVVGTIDRIAPDKPVASADVNGITNGDVKVSAVFSEDSFVREYSYDEENWEEYSDAIVFTQNGTVHFRSKDNAGNISEVTTFVVGNIDRIAPDKPTASSTASDGNVTVTAGFSDDSIVKEYCLDGMNWMPYVEALTFAEKGVVYFRGADAAGNISETTEYSFDPTQKDILAENTFTIQGIIPSGATSTKNLELNYPGLYTISDDYNFDGMNGSISILNKKKTVASGVPLKEVYSGLFRFTEVKTARAEVYSKRAKIGVHFVVDPVDAVTASSVPCACASRLRSCAPLYA